MTEPKAALQCLVVEDSPMMRRLLGSALSRVESLEITEAQDGLDALKKLASKRFDLIVTDLNMPIMDGLKLIRRVRDDATHRLTPIVVVTTERGEADRTRAMSLGANAYVTKPIQADELTAAVNRVLALAP
jgi:two-component system chemotaxis response regulator CheY